MSPPKKIVCLLSSMIFSCPIVICDRIFVVIIINFSLFSFSNFIYDLSTHSIHKSYKLEIDFYYFKWQKQQTLKMVLQNRIILLVYQTRIFFEIWKPFYPLIGNPFISIQNWTTKMPNSRIKIVLTAHVKPIQCRALFRLDRNSWLRKYCMASSLNRGHKNHKSDKSWTSQKYSFWRIWS